MRAGRLPESAPGGTLRRARRLSDNAPVVHRRSAAPDMVTLELALVLLLILTNGFLSMSEFAVVSSRRARLQAMAKAKARGAQSAIALAENPGRFLSTV